MKINNTDFSYKHKTLSNKHRYQTQPKAMSDTFYLAAETTSKLSFKGKFKILDLFKKKQKKDNDITISELDRKFSKSGIKGYEKLYDLMKTENGYSEILSDNLIELYEKTKSERYTEKLFRLNFRSSKFRPEIYNDMNRLLEKNIKPKVILSVFQTATNDGKNRYNPEITKFAVENINSCNPRDFAQYFSYALNPKTNEFSKLHFKTLLELDKKYKFSDEEFKEIGFLKTFNNENLLKTAKNEIENMIQLGFSPENIADVFSQYGDNPELELVKSTTKNLPPISDTQKLIKYVTKRAYCSSIKEKDHVGFNKENYTYFNDLYNTEKAEFKKYEKISEIAENIRVVKRSSHKELRNSGREFSLKAAEFMPVYDINKILQTKFPVDYPHLLKTFLKLNDRDKADFAKVHGYFSYSFANKSKKTVMKYFEKIYPKYQEKKSAADLLNIIDECWTDHNKTEFSKDKLKFALKNIDLEKEKILLLISVIEGKKSDMQKVNVINRLLENGFDIDELYTDKICQQGLWNERKPVTLPLNVWCDEVIELKKLGVSNNNIYKFLEKFKGTQKEKYALLDLRNEALNHHDILQTGSLELFQHSIDNTFLLNPTVILNTLKTIGKPAFVQMFYEGFNNFNEHLHLIGKENIKALPKCCTDEYDAAYEKLLEATNPVESKRYKNLEKEIKELKNKFEESQNSPQMQQLVNEINTKTNQKQLLVKNAIKEPKDIIETATLFYSVLYKNIDTQFVENLQNKSHVLMENLKTINKVLPLINPKNEKQRKEYNNCLNNLIGEYYLGHDLSKETIEKIRLDKSKYFKKLFYPNSSFAKNFASLLELLEENKDLSIKEIFDNLEQNKTTKKLFEKYNLDYNKWTDYKKSSNLTFKTKIYKNKHEVVKRLENDFNNVNFKKLPKQEQEKLLFAIKKAGFQIKETRNFDYFNNYTNLFHINTQRLKFLKNKHSINPENVKEIITAVKKEIDANDFWNTPSDKTTEEKKETFKKNLLEVRYNEAVRAEQNESESLITVQKADMNDIAHSLFLGNDSSCCCKVTTGLNSHIAPNYIKNKFINCIEVKDGNRFVGNTMIYPILIKDKPALLLDNIELKKEYEENDAIRNGIFACARQLAKELGHPEMPIYAGGDRHKVNMEIYPNTCKCFKILGSSGDDDIYIDFDTTSEIIVPDCIYESNLYWIDNYLEKLS